MKAFSQAGPHGRVSVSLAKRLLISLSAKTYGMLFLGILGGGLVLRVMGVGNETPVCHDEMRPEVELLLCSPVQFLVQSLRDSMARPGFVGLKTLGLLVSKLCLPSSAAGVPAVPFGFQIALDLASMIILMHIVYKWLVIKAEAKWPAALWAGLFWAASPVLIRYTHRLLPPTYALFALLCFYWIFFWACSKKALGAFFLTGVVAAACFMIYPGLYYLLLITPLFLLLPQIRSALSLRAVFYLGVGGVLLPLVLQLFMMAVKFTAHPNYFTYFGQLRHVGTHILQGEPRENVLFPFQLVGAAGEYQFILLLGLILAALIFRVRSALPWAGMLMGIYAIWVINGPLLNREVLYSRTVVLIYPLAVIAASLALVELFPNPTKRPWLIGSAAALLLGISGTVLMSSPVYRNHAERIRADISRVTRLSVDDFDLITHFNDYGVFAREHWVQLNQTMKSRRRHQVKKPLFVAYNLRAWCAPCYPILQPSVEPLLRYPSPIREPYFQFEGFDSAERNVLQEHPEPYDVKVYRADELLTQPRRWIKGNLPSWMDRWH